MPAMYRNKFAINEINNGALTAVKAMPQKDSTSDGTADFDIQRQTFMKTYQPFSAAAQQQYVQKKWIGNNRDASDVIRRRRVNSVGNGTLNPNGVQTSFTTYRDVNVVNTALNRVRAGGAIAPPKKNALRTNAPTPGFPTGTLVRSDQHTIATIQPKMAMSYKTISVNQPKHFH
jgi:hypothetical protein